VDHDSQRRQLAELVAQQAAQLEAWESGELYLLELAFRERLALLGCPATDQLGAALMAVAQLLAERCPEWGGDSRSTLCDVAVLGLRMMDDQSPPP
jgi:hypothetical protein